MAASSRPSRRLVACSTSWSFDPHVQLAIIIAAVLYVVAVRRVDRAHPSNRVPLSRTVAWLGGLVALEIALQSGLALYDTTLFSYHMVQHLLLTMVAAPLLVLGAPVTLLLRVSSAETRKRWILPVLHSRVVGFVSHPVVAWLTFTAVMWVSHLTALFDVALENPRDPRARACDLPRCRSAVLVAGHRP